MDLSRRAFAVSALGLAGLGAGSGCLGRLGSGAPAFLSYKGIAVQWTVDRTAGYVADLCWLWSDGRSRLFGWESAVYPDIVRSPTDVSVDADTADALDARFTAVRYSIGVSHVETTDWSVPLGAEDLRTQFPDSGVPAPASSRAPTG